MWRLLRAIWCFWMGAPAPLSPVFVYLSAARESSDRRDREKFVLAFLREIHHPDLDGYLRGVHGAVSLVSERMAATAERLRVVEDAVLRVEGALPEKPPTVLSELSDRDEEDSGVTTVSMAR